MSFLKRATGAMPPSDAGSVPAVGGTSTPGNADEPPGGAPSARTAPPSGTAGAVVNDGAGVCAWTGVPNGADTSPTAQTRTGVNAHRRRWAKELAAGGMRRLLCRNRGKFKPEHRL